MIICQPTNGSDHSPRVREPQHVYGRITSSSSESGTVVDDRRVRRDDERVERAMVGLLLLDF